MREFIKEEKRISELAKWKGAYVEIWIFNPTFWRVALLLKNLSNPNPERFLYLVATGCSHICGPFYWANSDLSIEFSVNDFNEPIASIRDIQAKFELDCSDFFLERVPVSEPYRSFS